jgi:Flp pilus assembly protein CpaB
LKNPIPIIVAVVLAVVVVFAIQNHVRKIEEQAAAKLKGSPVVAASVEIPKGATITESMLYRKQVPSQFIPRQALTTASDQRQVVGRRTRVTVYPNQLLLWSDLEETKRGGLSSLIPEGERAYTANLSQGIQISLLQLNDRVDILGIFSEPQQVGLVGQPGGGFGGQDQSVCVVLLQNVNILAIGDEIGEVYRNPEGASGGGGSITFSVTLQEAQLLLYAVRQGELAMVLRREGEIQVFPREQLPRITMAQMEQITGQLDHDRARRTIEVMKGREVQTIEVETNESGLQSFD